MTTRKISIIAREILQSWAKVNYAAKPYLDAMLCLETINDKYYYDDARSVILYFLANAGSYRGDTAKRIKLELKALIA